MLERPELLGARRIKLIERDALLDHRNRKGLLYPLVNPPGRPVLFYIEGEGGIGKTVLLEETIKKAKGLKARTPGGVRKPVVAPDDIVDLYYSEYHTLEGLADRIIQVLVPAGKSAFFREYEKKKEERKELIRREEWQKARELERQMAEAFAKGLNMLSEEEGPVLLALDTAEVLEYIQDPFQLRARLPLPVAGIASWLLERVLPNVKGDIVVLLAGRPGSLGKRIRKLKDNGWKIENKFLKPLSPKGCENYLKEVARVLEEEGEPQGAQRLRTYLTKYVRHLHECTGGRPILLAIVADILRTGNPLPEAFYTSKKASKEEIERALVNHLLNLHSPLGETLRIMSLLRRGINSELLARIADIEEEEAKRWLKETARLALVKTRPVWGGWPALFPYFLHDELYYLFGRYTDVEPEERRYRSTIEVVISYYEEKKRQLEKDLERKPALKQVYETRLRVWQAERMHYTLWTSLWEGLADYFICAEEALDGWDKEADMTLRAELLRSVAELRRIKEIPAEFEDTMNAYLTALWCRRALDEEPAQAIKIAEEIHEWDKWNARLAHKLNGLFDKYLRLYKAVAHIKRGEYDRAQKGLESLHEEMERYVAPNETAKTIITVLKAFCANYRGYLNRLAGQYWQAMERYFEALVPLRRMKATSLLKGTLINQAFAMAMVGRYRRARETIREALDKARGAGKLYMEARALNVWSIIELSTGSCREAVAIAREAHDILARDPKPNLEALVLTQLGRAYRYQWNALVEQGRELDLSSWRSTLIPGHIALEGGKGKENGRVYQTQGAVELYKQHQQHPQTSPYYIEALMESGCISREMAWVLKKLKRERPEDYTADLEHLDRLDKDLIENKSWRKVFENAASLAERRLLAAAGVEKETEDWVEQVKKRVEELHGNPYLPALALVNLGWHYHYQGEGYEKVEKCCNSAERVIPDEYFLKEGFHKPEMDREGAQLLLWAVMGKLEMLRFHELMRGFEKEKERDRDRASNLFREAVRHAVLSLEYNRLIARESLDRRRAEYSLNSRIMAFSEEERAELLPKLYKLAYEMVKYLGMEQPKDLAFYQFLTERFGPEELWR